MCVLVPRLTVGILWGYRGILGDKKGEFINSLILVVKQSYTDCYTQKIKSFSMIYNM
jgi:hypothetical protein